MKLKKILSVITACAIAATVPLCAVGCGDDPAPDATPTNTDTYDIPQDYARTYYEIFVRSFADGNGDGIGDFKGLLNNIDYLNDGDDSTTEDLGINGIWLMPINQSPSYHKYDVADYYSIDSQYGDMSDFEAFIDACKERDIWVQMDLVLNHTSTQHEWFKDAVAAAKRGAPVTSMPISRYNFVRGEKPGDKYYQVSGTTDYWYLGNFDSSMPDVNLKNPDVKNEIKKIVGFWLKKGVRSFRLDAVPYAFGSNADNVGEENMEFWTWFDSMCAEKAQEIYGSETDPVKYCYNVGEVWSSDSTITQYYNTGMSCFNYSWGASYNTGFGGYANYDRTGGNMLYNMPMKLEELQKDILDIDDKALLSNFLSNHDNNRSSSYFSNEPNRIKTAAALYLLSPGNAYIYYGEEIGAAGEKETPTSPDYNLRLAFNWGDSSKGVCKDPSGANYKKGQPLGSWASQTEDYYSVLTFYRNAIKLRNRFPEIARGVIDAQGIDASGKIGDQPEILAASGKAYMDYVNELNITVCAYTLTWNDRTVLIVHNLGTSDATVDTSAFEGYSIVGSLSVTGNGSVSLSGTSLKLGAGTTAVLKAVQAN